MKFSAIGIIALFASTCDAFTTPRAASTLKRSSTSLKFAPKSVPITEKNDPFKLGVASMTPDFSKKDGSDVWNKFCNWITCTENLVGLELSCSLLY